MSSITIPQLYDYLCSPHFKDEKSGNIFYNYYIYQYQANKEYEMRQQIHEFKEKLERPSNFVNALIIDLFSVFCEYLKEEQFGDQSLFEMTLEEEKAGSNTTTEELMHEANSDEFLAFVHSKIMNHIQSNDGYKHPYIFVHGIGKMFPYLRCNVFLTSYEKYNKSDLYKIILFYPGHQEGNSFSLFDTLHDDHTYRAILLVNEKNI